MLNKLFNPATSLDRAITLSVGAMLAMNLFVLAQQLQPSPTLALSQGSVAAQQA
jgi:hypothetical protein